MPTPMHEWKFDEEEGTGLGDSGDEDATLTLASTNIRTPANECNRQGGGGCVCFDGSHAAGTAVKPTKIKVPKERYTITFFFKTNVNDNRCQEVFNFGEGSHLISLWAPHGCYGNKDSWAVSANGDNVGDDVDVSASNWNDNEWHGAAVVSDGDVKTLYVGVETPIQPALYTVAGNI